MQTFALQRTVKIMLALLACSLLLSAQQSLPGSRTVMDAHNCYPYFEWWGDRIDRALSAGTPLAIEQDLAWHTDPKTGRSWSVVTHGEPTYGNEPTMDQYFFERVRPIVEKALRDGNRGNWPLITLNLDFKDGNPDHLAAVLSLLRKYQPWLTTSVKARQEADVQPLDVKPILVLTGRSRRATNRVLRSAANRAIEYCSSAPSIRTIQTLPRRPK